MSIQTWFRQKMFQSFHGHHLVYNQCWEDPRLDRQALQIKTSDNILMLTSAGCNALDYLLLDPARIDAVDLNPRQNALLELKKAGLQVLDYEDFYAFFGEGIHFGAEKIYRHSLRPLLPNYAQGFWDKNIDYFQPGLGHAGFYYHGTAGWVARIMGQYIQWLGLREGIEKVFSCEQIQDQARIYFDELKPYFWNDLLRWFTRRGATMSALGVPRSQFLQIEHYYIGGMAQFIEDALDTVFARLSLRDNYFYRLYLFGFYSKDCCPEYLRKENFATLRNRVQRIQTHNSSILDFLKSTQHVIHKVTLLDHMDWLYQNHYNVLAEQWNFLLSRTQSGSRVIWRSAAHVVDFIDPIPLWNGEKVASRLRYHDTLAKNLHAMDRVHTYGSFKIAEVL